MPAGGRFPLSFTFENTGATKVENIVVTVDGGECFTVDGGTNTAHYKSLAPGKTLTQELPMQAVPTCKSGAQGITVSFKYEYVDGSKRSAVTADIRLSVPVSQPDRFQLPDVLEDFPRNIVVEDLPPAHDHDSLHIVGYILHTVRNQHHADPRLFLQMRNLP